MYLASSLNDVTSGLDRVVQTWEPVFGSIIPHISDVRTAFKLWLLFDSDSTTGNRPVQDEVGDITLYGDLNDIHVSLSLPYVLL